MIEVDGLSRAYGNFMAVDTVSFDISAGQIVGLLGHNGAGKTTIMKMLSGFLEPSAGYVSIDGLDLASNTREVQQRLGYLPENLPIYPDMTVADYLHFAATMKGLAGGELEESLERAVHNTDLLDKLIDPISTLSRGYKQRVGVAQAILGSPRVLILDEPTNGLDPNQTQHMRDLIRVMAESATVILSTHIMQEVDAICDRVLVLLDGHLALDASLAELRSAAFLRVRCNLPLKQLREILPGRNMHEQSGDILIAIDGEPDAEAAAIAATIASSGGALYHLAPDVRDLETVFREVNMHKEVRDAA